MTLSVVHWKFLLAFPALLFGIGNVFRADALARWFQGKEGLEIVPFLAYLVAGLCLSISAFALFAHRWTIKPVAIALAVTSGAATYFMAKYDVAIDSSMVLNTVHTDATEVRQLLSWEMLPYAIGLIGVPVLLVLRTQIRFAAGARYLRSTLTVFGVCLAVALAALYANYDAIHRASNISNKYIIYSLVPVNVISGSVGAASKSARRYLRKRPAALTVDAQVARPGNLVVVLAIGESSRRANFSVYGYARKDTTPRLRGLSGLHLLDGVASRGSTIDALREILEQDDVKLPALVARAGVPTRCYVNFTLYDNCEGVGETSVSQCRNGSRCYDEDVVSLLEDDLTTYSSGYRFVVMHLGGGSHGPLYANRHPPEFRRFEPSCDDADVANRCTLEQLYNSYDNTILYVDHVITESIEALERSRVPYVFIYLSDHGESLMEDGRLFHGVPPGIALPREQAEIPLIVKSSVPMSIVERTAYSQPDIFDTVLGLFTIESPRFDLAGRFIERRDAPD